MAAVDISGTNGPGLTLVTNADATTGFAGTSGQADTTDFFQGSASYTYQSGKNARTSGTYTPPTNLDWSLTDGHLYFSMKCAVFPFAEPKVTGSAAASGLTVRITDGSGNYVEQHVAGPETWGGEWKQFVIDLDNTSELYLSSGTLIKTDIDVIEFFVDISNSGNIRIIDNTWLDVMYFGTGIVVTGTDADFKTAYDICNLNANRYPILHEVEETILVQGRVQFGDGGGTSTTYGTSGERVVFRNAPVSAALFKVIADSATMNITSANIAAAGVTDSTRFAFDMTLATDVTMIGSSFTRAGLIDFASGQDVQSSVFNDCGMIDPGTALFENNSITNSNETGAGTGALYLPLTNSVDLITFDGNDRDVLIDQAGTYNDESFTHGTNNFDLDYNNASAATFNVPADGNTATVTNTGAGSLTVVAGQKVLTLTDLVNGTSVTIVNTATRAVLQDGVAGVTGIITYSHSGGETVDILLLHLNYDPNSSDILGLTLPSSDSTIKFQQANDPNYKNP